MIHGGRVITGFLLLFVLLTSAVVHAQVFYESLPDGKHAFYFDKAYYLSDKSCMFTTVERIGRFDFAGGVFAGEFHDYNNSGQLVLTGVYENGMKNGVFRAYHSNGQLKWEGAFTDNFPSGSWYYYYPDGKPMLLIGYDEQGLRIEDYWDLRGRHRVESGDGRYEMKIEIDGYNEYGAAFFNRRGRVREGRPTGRWTVALIYEDSKSEQLGTEHYQNGSLIAAENDVLNNLLPGMSRHALLPLNRFIRAEEMIAKSCSIDQQSGFTEFLSRYLEEWFEGYINEDIVPQKLIFRLSVGEDGSAHEFRAEQTLDHTQSAQALLQALHSVGFWLPSYLDGDYIEDELTLRLQIFPDRENNRLRFFGIEILREKGF